MAFLYVLCSTVRLRGTSLVPTFEYPRSRMIWLTVPLLLERLSASCRVVMCQSSWQHASDFDYQLMEWLEWGQSWSSAFPVPEAITLLTQRPRVLLPTTALP
jgi:hypothetical protein